MKNPKQRTNPLAERILRLLGRPGYTPLDAQGLGQRLSVKPPNQEEFKAVLTELERTGQIARIRRNRYTLPTAADLIPGRIFISRSGAGTLQPEDPKLPQVQVPSENTGTALHQDRVLVRREAILGSDAPYAAGMGPRGKVIRILERARTQIVGTLQRSKQFFYVVPDDPRIPHDIYVPEPGPGKPQPAIGDKVVVELIEWLSRHVNPEGKIVEVLGPPSKPGVDIASVLRQYQLTRDFPAAVLEESSKFGDSVRPEDLKGRKDCRNHPVVTIDPDDARDFDDAICIQKEGNSEWRLWVHIADVAHYVTPGSALDREASARGNSTYLVDRVIPMLPESLSNGLCSLVPNQDRLTKCIEFTLSKEGRVLTSKIYSAVIRSKRRFTYEEALAVLKRPSRDSLEQMLDQANRLAQKLRQNRFRNGALDLDFPEYKIRLNDDGELVRVDQSHSDISHQLIEEFMLIANETVAARLRQTKRAAVYRIHEQPAPERLEELRQQMLAQDVPAGNLNKKGELQRLLARLKQHPASRALTISVLRSLKRARYAIEPLGHFGLAKSDYTHFTSPIRRYADLLVHRALSESRKLSRDALVQIADHISFTERNSADAEQDSKTMKLLAYLQSHIEQRSTENFAATVIEVRNFGFFVELTNYGVSGMVRLSAMDDDFYIFDESRARLRGRRRGRTISVGDTFRVRPVTVDFFKKQANFVLVQPGKPEKRR